MSTKCEGWAVVELMGHQRIAGKLSEETIAGAAMLRIDVPAVEGHAAFTRYYGAGAIYSICPCDESIVMVVAKEERQPPVSPWQIPKTEPAAITSNCKSPVFGDDEEDEDDDFYGSNEDYDRGTE